MPFCYLVPPYPFDKGIRMPYEVLRVLMKVWLQYKGAFDSCYLVIGVDSNNEACLSPND